MKSHYDISARVKLLSWGERLEVSMSVLKDVACDPGFSPADMIMESIAGSAYTFAYYEKPESGNVVFHRLDSDVAPLQDGLRSYVSPDRRHLFAQLPNGLWKFKDARP
jgi:hypothetical protein